MVRVNTKSGKIKPEGIRKEYLLFGNRGLVEKVMCDEVNPKCDPVGAENKLIVCTGLLAGTTFPTGHSLLSGLYGVKGSMGTVMKIGHQTILMERTFNKVAGFTEKDDRLPEFFYKEFAPASGEVFDISYKEMEGIYKR